MAKSRDTREVRADLSPDDWLTLESYAMQRGKVGRQLASDLLAGWCAKVRETESQGKTQGGGASAGAGIDRSASADAQ